MPADLRAVPAAAPADVGAATRPRVLFVADAGSPRMGMTRALEELLAELDAAADIEVLYLFRDAAGERSYASSTLGLHDSLRGRLAGLRRLRAQVRQVPDHRLVAVGLWAAMTLVLATIGTGRRITLWEHSVLPWRLRRERTLALGAVLLRLFAHRVRHVVAVSPATARVSRVLVRPFARVQTVPNLVEEPADEPDPEADRGCRPGLLLGVGALSRVKNWSLAIRAMAHLPEYYRLQIAGDGALRDELQGLAEELGLTHRVALLGFRADIADLYRGCAAVVHPSYAETFGYTLMEAAAHRRPVVALARPVMDEFIPTLVPGRLSPPDPEAYAAAVRAAVEGRHDFAAAAARRREQLDRDRTVREWLAVLSSAR